jgi:hypothetical protein
MFVNVCLPISKAAGFLAGFISSRPTCTCTTPSPTIVIIPALEPSEARSHLPTICSAPARNQPAAGQLPVQVLIGWRGTESQIAPSPAAPNGRHSAGASGSMPARPSPKGRVGAGTRGNPTSRFPCPRVDRRAGETYPRATGAAQPTSGRLFPRRNRVGQHYSGQ